MKDFNHPCCIKPSVLPQPNKTPTPKAPPEPTLWVITKNIEVPKNKPHWWSIALAFAFGIVVSKI